MSATNTTRTVMVQGRIVWTAGDLFKGKPKVDQYTKQPVIDQKTGKQKVEFGFGLAVPKSILGQTAAGQPGEIWAAMHEEAYSLYPSRQLPPAFAMKYKDGDGVDHNGQSFATREGYAGHIVLACTTSIPIKFFKYEAGNNILINEGIKCGDYVNVQVSVKAHPPIGQGKAGLYLNPNAVQFLGYGKEIVNAPSGDNIFGATAPALPSGASAVPLAPQQGMLIPTAQQSLAAPMQPAFPQAAQQSPQPHYAVLPGIHQPQQQQAPQMPAMPNYGAPQAAPVPQMPVPGMPTYQ